MRASRFLEAGACIWLVFAAGCTSPRGNSADELQLQFVDAGGFESTGTWITLVFTGEWLFPEEGWEAGISIPAGANLLEGNLTRDGPFDPNEPLIKIKVRFIGEGTFRGWLTTERHCDSSGWDSVATNVHVSSKSARTSVLAQPGTDLRFKLEIRATKGKASTFTVDSVAPFEAPAMICADISSAHALTPESRYDGSQSSPLVLKAGSPNWEGVVPAGKRQQFQFTVESTQDGDFGLWFRFAPHRSVVNEDVLIQRHFRVVDGVIELLPP